MSGYQGVPGGPSDPATPGPYCLALCWCGTCPQYAEQARQTEALRRAEYEGRDHKQGARLARQQRRHLVLGPPTAHEEAATA